MRHPQVLVCESDGRLAALLAEHRPDVAVVAAYGRILPGDALQTPRLGCLNVHASLLPELRGAAPAQWAVASGLRERLHGARDAALSEPGIETEFFRTISKRGRVGV